MAISGVNGGDGREQVDEERRRFLSPISALADVERKLGAHFAADGRDDAPSFWCSKCGGGEGGGVVSASVRASADLDDVHVDLLGL